jgi:hypothetical protein
MSEDSRPGVNRDDHPAERLASTDNTGTVDSYATAFGIYHRLGWSVMPIPRGKKKPPPTGFTGRDGATPSYADMLAWADDRPGDGVAIRLTRTVIGIDVDHYGTKRGGDTLAEAEKRCGPLPPTYRSTSRDDRVSGIRLYRIPEGIEFPGELDGGGIEICQHHHRYVLCWPSVHPSGERYRWVGEFDGTVTDEPPPLEYITELPAKWIDELTVEPARNAAEVPAGLPVDVSACITQGAMSPRVLGKLSEAMGELFGPNCRHDEIRDHVLGLLRCGKDGEPGVKQALNALNEAFVNRVAKDRDGGKAEARREFKSYVYGKKVSKLLADDSYQTPTGTTNKENAGQKAKPETTRQATEFDARNMFQQARHNAAENLDGEVVDGATLLDDIAAFLARFIAYPSDHAKVAHTLWIAHTWLMDCWDSTPRVAFLSPEPGSGKTRALEVSEPLVPNPIHSVNVTSAYLFRKIAEAAPTLLYDEIDTVFGPKARENEDIRGVINSGHRNGATAGRCVVHGKRIETEDLPSYCAVAVAGLNDLPDTIMDRCVVIRMRRRAPTEPVEPWRPRVNVPEATPLRDRLVGWSVGVENTAANHLPDMPDGITDRHADCWEALLAIADLAGGRWPEAARVAAVALVADSRNKEPSLGVRLLWDIKALFAKCDNVALVAAEILKDLRGIEDSPWGVLGRDGNGLTPRGLAQYLRRYEIRPKNIRTKRGVLKGYERQQFADAWKRYPEPPADDDDPLSSPKSATSATFDLFADQGA